MRTPLGPLIDMLAKIIAEHPGRALLVFIAVGLGPVLVWLGSGKRGGGHRR